MQERRNAARPPVASRTLTILYHHRTRSRDGQSVHIDALICALREIGHRVVVVEPDRVPPTQASMKKKLLPKALYELLEFGYSLVEFAKLAAAAWRHRPDALYERANVFMLSGVWAARMFRIPLLLEINAPLAFERGRFGGLAWPRFAAWTERHAWRAADCVLPVTNVLAREVAKAGVPSERIAIVPNGVDIDRLGPIRAAAEAKQRLKLGEGLVLGFVGFVRDWNRLDRVVELLAREPLLAEARLLIIGDGPASGALREQAKDLNVADRVVITGVVNHEDLPNYLSAVDIALQPESTPYASPLKFFEYMAFGRAIVAPDRENVREILENEVDSLLFAPDDEAELSRAICRLATDDALRRRLGAAASEKIVARNLTWRRNAERVAAIASELTSRRGARQYVKKLTS